METVADDRIEKIQAALTQLRPFLLEDGGDITFSAITDEGVVQVELHGACSSCSMSLMTLKAGVEEAVMRAVPGTTGVEAINMPDPEKATPFGQ